MNKVYDLTPDHLMAFISGTWKMNSSVTFSNLVDHSQYERLYIAFVNLKTDNWNKRKLLEKTQL